ncbi:MAG TPA: helix-turn-helix transcriptional regulator [Xanthobacteraceae bacterium]|nr:helix-turn-helix transcriptional regulator [Xanthobacteraceae bacterium]
MARPPDIKRLLAKNVRRLRKARGLSQSALATDAGQHQYVISKVENAQLDVRLETIGRIAAALGVDPRELFEE